MSTAVKDYSAYLKQLSDAKKRKDMDALRSAYEKSVAQLQQAGAGLDREYRQEKNTAAGASAQAGRNFAQYAAANGLTNGAAGQAELARNIALQNDLAALDREKAGKKADLSIRTAQALADYETGKAQVEADAEAELAQSLYKEQVRQEETAYEAARDAVKDAQWQRELDFAIQKFWYGKGGQTSATTQDNNSGNTSTDAVTPKMLLALANQVLRGEWGDGAERRERLAMAGYDPDAVQRTVELILAGRGEQVK